MNIEEKRQKILNEIHEVLEMYDAEYMLEDIFECIDKHLAPSEIKNKEGDHICQSCGGKGYSASCDHCIPY